MASFTSVCLIIVVFRKTYNIPIKIVEQKHLAGADRNSAENKGRVKVLQRFHSYFSQGGAYPPSSPPLIRYPTLAANTNTPSSPSTPHENKCLQRRIRGGCLHPTTSNLPHSPHSPAHMKQLDPGQGRPEEAGRKEAEGRGWGPIWWWWKTTFSSGWKNLLRVLSCTRQGSANTSSERNPSQWATI